MELVKEQSTSYATFEFRDKRGRLATPTAVTYRIDCLTTGQQVKAWTSISPAQKVEIEISPEENSILGGYERETRRVTCIAAYGSGNEDQATEEADYEVKNLKFL